MIKYLPSKTSKRINNLSPEETIFSQSKDLFNNALTESGFKRKTTFQQQKDKSTVTNNTQNTKRKLIWFDPKQSLNVSKASGKKFFSLLGKDFLKMHTFIN